MSLKKLEELQKELLSLSDLRERQELFVSNKTLIDSCLKSGIEEQVLLAYSISVEIYAKSLFEEERYAELYVYLELLEKDFRAYKFSDEKMRILEEFQFMLGFSLNKAKNYYRSRDAYDALVHCRPENKVYQEEWRKNELTIAKKNFILTFIVGLIISSISYLAKSYSGSDSYDVVFYSGIIILFVSIGYYIYNAISLKK